MTIQKNAAFTAVQAEPCPNLAVMWVPCLQLEGEVLPCGLVAIRSERLETTFSDIGEAMRFAEQASQERPDAIGVSCLREVVEVQS